MLVTIPLCKYNSQYVIQMPPVKNTIIKNSLFIRIIYSTHNIMTNGLYVYIENEPKQDIYTFEKDILNTYHSNKIPVYSLHKYILRNHHKPILKISGIWETETTYGIAYKLIHPF